MKKDVVVAGIAFKKKSNVPYKWLHISGDTQYAAIDGADFPSHSESKMALVEFQ